MSVVVFRGDEGYAAKVEPPSIAGAWSTTTPITRRALRAKMIELGVHSTTITESIRAADRIWLRAHPDEQDDGEVLMVDRSPSGDGYWAVVDLRTGVWAPGRSLSADELLKELLNLGVDAGRIQATIGEADRVWQTDSESGRGPLGSLDVVRTDEGYKARTLGRPGRFPDDPLPREQFTSLLGRIMIKDDEIQRLIDRANGDWESRPGDKPAG